MNRRSLLKTWLAAPLAWLGFKATPATADTLLGMDVVRRCRGLAKSHGAKPLKTGTVWYTYISYPGARWKNVTFPCDGEGKPLTDSQWARKKKEAAALMQPFEWESDAHG